MKLTRSEQQERRMNEVTKQEQHEVAQVGQQHSQLAAIVNMVERVAMNPDADMAKLEKMLDMQERVLDREAKMEFSAAMSKAQSEMGRVSADAENKQTRSRYATYGALDKAVRPIYSKYGFALSFNTEETPSPEVVRVVCDVSHIGGYTKHYRVDMPADGKGAKGGDVMTKTHAAGAAMAYGMRYLLKMIFNIAIGEDDTDGNVPSTTLSVEQIANITALAEEVGADMPKFLKWLKVEDLKDLDARHYDRAISALEAKRG